jgi:hypothetical protein
VASAAEVVSGTATSTLGNATVAASGSSLLGIVGNVSTTLQPVTAVATGAEAVSGVVNTALDNTQIVASGLVAVPVSGSVGTTLGNATASIAGTSQLPAQLYASASTGSAATAALSTSVQLIAQASGSVAAVATLQTSVRLGAVGSNHSGASVYFSGDIPGALYAQAASGSLATAALGTSIIVKAVQQIVYQNRYFVVYRRPR